MIALKRFWNGFKNVAILFSFVVNFVLIVVLLFVVLLIFQIKNGIAQPLINGLYGSFAGLDEARILTNINVKDSIRVNDTIPVKLNIPLQQDTVVVLTKDVPLRVSASFTLRDGTTLNGTVAITLPTGLQLPVALNLNVPVDSTLPIDLHVPINLNVPVDIPLNQTQLHDPFSNLRSLFDPFVRLLGNLPSEWNDIPPFIGNVLAGKVNLMAPNQYTNNPWPGFRTGLGTPNPNAPATTPVPGGENGLIPPTATTEGATGGAEGTSITPATAAPTHVQDLGILTPTPHP